MGRGLQRAGAAAKATRMMPRERNELELESAERDLDAATKYLGDCEETVVGAANNFNRARQRLEAARKALKD